MTTPSPSNQQDLAESLRLQGNDAFGTQDYPRALELYRQSIACHPAVAKTYANLAATLCKLGQYHDAQEPAARATTLDPRWAKGWWRRGVVAELCKYFAQAHQYLDIAVSLAPKEKAFQKSLRDVAKRIQATDKRTNKGFPILGQSKDDRSSSKDISKTLPSVKAYFGVQDAMKLRNGGQEVPHYQLDFLFTEYNMEKNRQNNVIPSSKTVTSEQWLFHGMEKWVAGMHSAMAALSLGASPEVQRVLQPQLPMIMRMPHAQRKAMLNEMMGGDPFDNSMSSLLDAFCHFGGAQSLVLEMGGRVDQQRMLVPPIPPVQQFLAYQTLSILWSIDMQLNNLFQQYQFPNNGRLVCGKAVLDASQTLFDNLNAEFPHKNLNMKQDPTPQQVVDYIKTKLLRRYGWNGGVRVFVSLQFRGTLMYAFVVRMIAKQLAEANKLEAWANTFIALADQEFGVSEEKDYKEKGTAFMPSLRVGALAIQHESHEVLRAGEVNGPYSMEKALDLCMDIVDMANEVDDESELDGSANASNPAEQYHTAMRHVAWRQKPLARAQATIAVHLNFIRQHARPQDFQDIARHHGINPTEQDVDPFALIAETYKIAAQNQLPDDADAATYWWAYGVNLVQAQPTDTYTMADLRRAISMAEAAEQARDVRLFGQNRDKDGANETICKETARYFRNKPDTFQLPQVRLENANGEKPISLVVGSENNEDDNVVICADLNECFSREHDRMKEMAGNDASLDTTELQKDHGFDPSQLRVPSLETLCIRSLHKSGFGPAQGETDGAVIQYKAMMAAAAAS